MAEMNDLLTHKAVDQHLASYATTLSLLADYFEDLREHAMLTDQQHDDVTFCEDSLYDLAKILAKYGELD